jgi:hypothetical protein
VIANSSPGATICRSEKSTDPPTVTVTSLSLATIRVLRSACRSSCSASEASARRWASIRRLVECGGAGDRGRVSGRRERPALREGAPEIQADAAEEEQHHAQPQHPHRDGAGLATLRRLRHSKLRY